MSKYIYELREVLEKRKSTTPATIQQIVKNLANHPILLYGAGAFGTENFVLLQKYGVTPVAFLDRNAKVGDKKLGIPIYHPDDENLSKLFREECTVYISITAPKRVMNSIKRDLLDWGYTDCHEVQMITARQVCFEGVLAENPGRDYLTENEDKIMRGLSLMGDEESCRTYVSSVKAHLMRSYSHCIETDFPTQYFEAGISLKKGFTCFVDCGAYNGDSLGEALRYCKTIGTYIAFEPIVGNYEMLSHKVDDFGGKIGNSYLFPCGVAEKTGSARFTIAASSSAITDGRAGEILPLVRLDDVLKNVSVSFLKMDIEGAELSALHGAANLIRKQSPDLAISVYHFANHYWDIPCYISELNPKYKFFLRAHTAATLESVLYCSLDV